MRQTCKQCGREFELTENEIDFYEKNGLNLPTKCKECRQVKKGQKPGGKQPEGQAANSSEAALLNARGGNRQDAQGAVEEDAGPAPGWTRGKLIATFALLAVVLVICFGGTYLIHAFF